VKDGISAVLIVKDEEKVLERCLRSLEGVDQIVVLDTGSKDRTFKIAREFTTTVAKAKIVPFHFAEARNRADGYAREDWILTIDADEILMPGSLEAIRAELAESSADGARVTFGFSGENGENPSSLPKLKIYRRGLWEWKYRIHEQLIPKKYPTKILEIPQGRIEHKPPSEKAARRAQNLELLKVSVNESPEHLRNTRQLGMEYFISGAYAEAITWFEKYLETPSQDALDLSETLVHLARAYDKIGNNNAASEAFERAIVAAPERREPRFYKAVALMKIGRCDEAIMVLESCLAIPESKKPEFHLNVDAIWDGSLPREAIEACLADIEDAKQRLMKTTQGEK
jgi:glycosyltransferase involved in cell wall biosynthesis